MRQILHSCSQQDLGKFILEIHTPLSGFNWWILWLIMPISYASAVTTSFINSRTSCLQLFFCWMSAWYLNFLTLRYPSFLIIEFIRRCDRILTFFFLSLSDSRLLGKKTFDQALLKSVDYQFCVRERFYYTVYLPNY